MSEGSKESTEDDEELADETESESEAANATNSIRELTREHIQNFRDWAGYKILSDTDEDLDIEKLKKQLDQKDKQSEEKILREIIDGTHRPHNDDLKTSGVLLRDEILYYQRSCDLIKPFEPDSLKPAAYELRVGDQYSVEGESHKLDVDESLEIGPFEVAIIKTRERVNLPHFMIGRWNIKVSKAYDGLLWVGGPQVDPGYSGYLFCPIYNLSDTEVTLGFEEELAVIDFVKTTPFDKDGTSAVAENWDDLEGEWEYSDDFENEPPEPEKYKDDMKAQNRITFSQYEPDSLQSALFAEVEKRFNTLDNRIEQLEKALRLSFAAFITIIAVLFSALSLIATPGSSESSGGIVSAIGLDAALNLALSSLPYIVLLIIMLIAISIYMKLRL